MWLWGQKFLQQCLFNLMMHHSDIGVLLMFGVRHFLNPPQNTAHILLILNIHLMMHALIVLELLLKMNAVTSHLNKWMNKRSREGGHFVQLITFFFLATTSHCSRMYNSWTLNSVWWRMYPLCRYRSLPLVSRLMQVSDNRDALHLPEQLILRKPPFLPSPEALRLLAALTCYYSDYGGQWN